MAGLLLGILLPQVGSGRGAGGRSGEQTVGSDKVAGDYSAEEV